MIADVSLGALLSGGVDSTTVVSLMQSRSPRRVKTFTIGYQEADYNEAGHALAIARYLGTDHTELYVTSEDCMEVVPLLPSLYSEPFADVSQIPTFIVSRLARGEVTVALSGDGADELFAGYPSYFRCMKHWNNWKRVPLTLRRGVAGAMGIWGRLGWHVHGPDAPSSWSSDKGSRRLPAKMERRSMVVPATGPVDLFARKRAHCRNAGDLVVDADAAPSLLTQPELWARVSEPLQAMMHLDLVSGLVDDILVKVDRASMGVSLEVRCPFLDRRVLEFAWRLPLSMRVGSGGGKRILRHLLERYVPGTLTDRPKLGFGVPIASWMRGPLRDWAEVMLDTSRLRQEGFLRPSAVQRVWRQHLSGWHNHEQLLWSILMFQAWHDVWGKAQGKPMRVRA
jgi:asparagine synthase (glutamine-hydrolysing)